MAPKENCPVDWQLKCGEIKQRGEHLLKSEQWTDCSFLVGEQGVIIRAHKLILAMASPVFEAMFYGLIAEGNHPVLIPDIQPETFRDLLKYIYTDNIELKSPGSACDLYLAAQKYLLTHLTLVCSVYLAGHLTPETVCRTYELALMVDETNLIKDCEELIKKETSSILTSKGYLDSSIDTLEKVFAMEPLNISSELDLLEAAEVYAKALNRNQIQNRSEEFFYNSIIQNIYESETQDVQTESSSEDNTESEDNRAEIQIRKLVKQIRFLTIKPTELAGYPTLTSLLSESELLALLMNTLTTQPCVPMPEGFSLSKKKRVK